MFPTVQGFAEKQLILTSMKLLANKYPCRPYTNMITDPDITYLPRSRTAYRTPRFQNPPVPNLIDPEKLRSAEASLWTGF